MMDYYTLIADWWRLFKRYQSPPEDIHSDASEAFWVALNADVEAFLVAHEKGHLAHDLCLAMIGEIGRREGTNRCLEKVC